MIILQEVAQKLEAILNGTDSEVGTNGSIVKVTNPTAFYFQVETEGFHLDHIVAPSKDKNFIPVFVSAVGGQFNPIPDLEQGTASLRLDFYYPVSFKKDFFALGGFLVKAFVGRNLNYGDITGKAVTNLSFPQYGEITQPLDLKEFENWTNNKFKKTIEKHEPYLSMTITLYISNAAEGFVFGNGVTCQLKFTYEENTFTLLNVPFDGANIQSNSQTQSEQLEETNESTSLPFGTAYGTSIKLYPNLITLADESTEEEPVYFYKELLKIWLAGNIQEVDCELTFTIGGDSDLSFTRNCFISSIVTPINRGELLSLTLSFANKTELEEEA